MKILIVAPSLDPVKNVSGVSAVVNFIIANNKKCEYIHFLLGKSDGEKGAINRVLRVAHSYRAWRKLLKETEADVIHYNYPLDAPSILRDFFFIREACKQRKRMVIHLHGGLFLFEKKKPFVIKKFMKGVLSLNCPFITQSDRERDQIRKEFHTNNVYILPNCVDLTEAYLYTKEIDSRTIDILYLGRIEPNKGMDYLYLAMAECLKNDLDMKLHFAGVEQGNNDYIGRFNKLLGDRFVYEGIVTGTKKTEILKNCQVFILPSLYEGLPMSLIECMSFGLIPVVTEVGSISEYVKNGENGLLLKVRDNRSIVDALTRLQNSRELQQRLSVAARATIFTHFSPEKYVSVLNQIYLQT